MRMRQIDNMKIATLFLLIAVALAACGPIRDEPVEEPGSSTVSPADPTPDPVASIPEAPTEETGPGSDPSQANSDDVKAPVDEGSPDETDDAGSSHSDLPLPAPEHPKYPNPEIEIPPPRD